MLLAGCLLLSETEFSTSMFVEAVPLDASAIICRRTGRGTHFLCRHDLGCGYEVRVDIAELIILLLWCQRCHIGIDAIDESS